MNWPFRSLSRTSSPASSSALPPDCESIEPLLPLYADGMASPGEVRLVEAHLPGCEGCRVALSWMQATHRALASRPVAVPPANLHSRIAEAIAASSAAPVTLRPARSFTLRPAYAAAASLTVLGFILSYPLWHLPAAHLPSVSVIKPAPKAFIASVPPVTPKVKHVLPHAARVKPSQPLVARNVPADTIKSVTAKHALAPKKAVPVSITPDRVADNAPVPASPHAHVSLPVKPAGHPVVTLHDKVASAKITPTEKRHPSASETIAPKTVAPKIAPVPMLARHDKEPLPVPVDIKPPTVIVQPPPVAPTVSLASASGDGLGSVRSSVGQMRTAPYAKTYLTARQAYLGAANAMHTLDNEHTGYQPAVYTP